MLQLRRGLLLAIACATVAGASGASAQVRLYSASEDETTSKLAAELDKAHIAHLAALDAHRVYLVEALARDRSLLVQRELAERDAFLALVLSAKSRGRDPRALVAEQISNEWSELAGSASQPSSYPDFVSAANALRPLKVERAGMQRNRSALIAAFEAKGGKGSYCKPDGSGEVKLETLGATTEAQGLRDSCGELATNDRQIRDLYRFAGGASPLLGNTGSPAGGMLGDALAEAKEIDALTRDQDALVKLVAKQVKDLDAYYQCQLGRLSTEQAIRADAAAVQSALDTLATADAAKVFDRATFDGLWHTLVTQKVDPDCSKPAPAPDESAEADAPKSSSLLDAIRTLNGYSADDAILSLIREAALDVQGSALDDAVKGLAASPGSTPDSVTARRAMAALRIFGALDRLYRADAGKLPDVAGVLVALADVRMRQATAKIEADRLAELDRLSKLRLTALAQRAVLLAGAQTELAGRTDAGLTNALRRYAESVNRGAIPATVIGNDMVKGRYLPWLDREKAVVDAGYAVLTPAAAQLQAYGKGGLKPETIAQFLQAIGLGAIAVTK